MKEFWARFREPTGYDSVLVLRLGNDSHFHVEIWRSQFEGWTMALLVYPYEFSIEWRLGISRRKRIKTKGDYDDMPF